MNKKKEVSPYIISNGVTDIVRGCEEINKGNIHSIGYQKNPYEIDKRTLARAFDIVPLRRET